MAITIGLGLITFFILVVVGVWDEKVSKAIAILSAGAGVCSYLFRLLVRICNDLFNLSKLNIIEGSIEEALENDVMIGAQLLEAQDLIYESRSNCVLVPEWLYRMSLNSRQNTENAVARAHESFIGRGVTDA